ncbi:hydantoinase/oxoprolinase family protein [Thalassobaculum litoreum]|uniref:N-methylhydantoinase A n=1 Tax=Thalassobaculum litoreum DSM 18839 TaxID=1123362 RepID=A0A8G2F236_9PROT|nr:hydantoinase/oxoprolinase family protein [Thalassobaculum litoreum]SDF39603.1 N-methylhydantoinase A [Thalassobaculum litoreum DSM 18839]
MGANPQSVRLAVDVGGTFTDVALEIGDPAADGRRVTSKVLTTSRAPEQGVIDGVEKAVAEAGIEPGSVTLIIHGTTLATNALIERKGAKTALITTDGHRDAVEMAQENRFEQYDINIDRPDPIVPRYLRWSVRERMNYRGDVLVPLDEESVRALIPKFEENGVEAVAIGLLHSYANGAHEARVAEIIAEARPDLAITLSSEVCPEIREYERQSTASANAYVQPKMAGYLRKLEDEMRSRGFGCPFLLMTSGGGLTDLDTAVRFPIRLVESGPAGGAILATEIAKECGLANVVSYDMGGTTAKICLIDNYAPQMTRTFEVARVYRNMKGSGLPVRIPAIEMVEIGAGGGSIAHVDNMGRLQVGPESAGSEPGPACYGRGGTRPTVTDGDVVMGKVDPARFAGGSVALDIEASQKAVASDVGKPMELEGRLAAFALAEIVDENMANAARVHAIEWGKDISARAMIAFGGAAPLHAARLAEKLAIDTIVVPTGAGVGSAIGFLRAPVSYEVVRSRYLLLSDFDAGTVNELLSGMSAEARAIVSAAAVGVELTETRVAYMRYSGQGHEITVPLPEGDLTAADGDAIRKSFEAEYAKLYGRTIPDVEPEILSWTLTVAAPIALSPEASTAAGDAGTATPIDSRVVFDPDLQRDADYAIHARTDLAPGMTVAGPALIVEDQTTTVVTSTFDAKVDGLGYLILTAKHKTAA